MHLPLFNATLNDNEHFFHSFNKYSQITARAVRQSLKESERVKAEKHGLTAVRYQHWENGKGGEQVRFIC